MKDMVCEAHGGITKANFSILYDKKLCEIHRRVMDYAGTAADPKFYIVPYI